MFKQATVVTGTAVHKLEEFSSMVLSMSAKNQNQEKFVAKNFLKSQGPT